MTTRTAVQHRNTPEPAPAKVQKGLALVSWEVFQRKYLVREDGNTYEWTNGIVEKTPSTMDITQLFIWLNINKAFQELLQKTALQGSLITEADIFLDEQTHRRPDICFLTHAQVLSGIKERVQIPAFVAEIVSPNDKATKVTRKVQEYFAAGVQVVWNIYPMLQEVHVYESPKASRICRGDDLCSAEKAIPGFALPVSEILKEEA